MFPLPSRLPSHRFCIVLLGGTMALSQLTHATPVGAPFPGPSGLGVIPTTQTVAPDFLATSLCYEYVSISGTDGNANLCKKTDIEGFSTSNPYFALHGKHRLYTSPDECQ